MAELVADNERLARRWRPLLGVSADHRLRAHDQLAREALLALSSDWAFMISKDSAAAYAQARHDLHHRRFHQLADLVEAAAAAPADRSAQERAEALADRLRGTDGPFGALDSRVMTLAARAHAVAGVPVSAVTTRR